jgi:hypothetical protein
MAVSFIAVDFAAADFAAVDFAAVDFAGVDFTVLSLVAWLARRVLVRGAAHRRLSLTKVVGRVVEQAEVVFPRRALDDLGGVILVPRGTGELGEGGGQLG